ncbi:MAG: hypothetical protein AB7P02_09350 [Alphaproteobacteria bacterium]
MGKTRPRGLSKSEIARKLGVSSTLISNLTLRGVIPTLPDGKVSLATARKVLDARKRQKRTRQPRQVSQVEAERRKAVALAEKHELDLRERSGELVNAAAVRKRVFDLARIDRDAWLSWPTRVGAQMAAALGVEAGVMTSELERHVRQHLEERAAARSVDAAGDRGGRPGMGPGNTARSVPDGLRVG